MQETLKPFEPHPEGRLTPVERVPCLDASELAWAGIIERGADGDMWPFDELTEETDFLSARGYNTPILELTKLDRREISPERIWLGASFKTTTPGAQRDSVSDDWSDFTLVSTRPHFGGRRWWFECPGCQVRRAMIYLIPCCYALCRECLRLTYVTKQEHNACSRHGKGWRHFRYLLHKLGGKEQARARRAFRRRVLRSEELGASQASEGSVRSGLLSSARRGGA